MKWGIMGRNVGANGTQTTGDGVMSMFMGEYQHSLDEKGRITIPSKFRERLGESFVITKGLDESLFIYPAREWEAISEKLTKLPLTQSDARAFVRMFFSGATESSMDKQGRTLLPQNLREYAKIEKDVVLLGVFSRIEVWSKEIWTEYQKKAESSYNEIAEHLVDLGI